MIEERNGMHSLRLAAALGAAFAAAVFALPAFAQDYPAKPIRMMVSFGGGGEANARIIAENSYQFLGQPIVLEANGAAGGSIAVMNVVRAEPDGYTILYSTAQTLLIRPHLVRNNPFDPLKDLTPLVQLGEATQCLAVSPTLPVKTFKEFIDYAKRNPGKVSYATTGIGTTGHLAGTLIERLTGIHIVHVPYKSGSQSIPDLIAGRIQASFTTLSTFAPMLDKLKVLAVTQGSTSERLPNVPLVADILPGYEVPPGWIGVLGPAGMSPAVVKRLTDGLLKGANLPEVKKRIAQVGTTIKTKPPEEFAVSIRKDNEVAARLIKASGVKPE
jgi:tripartite-type tricarboxylate transporter receptor subunit TctC